MPEDLKTRLDMLKSSGNVDIYMFTAGTAPKLTPQRLSMRLTRKESTSKGYGVKRMAPIGPIYRLIGPIYRLIGPIYRLIGPIYRLIGLMGKTCELFCVLSPKERFFLIIIFSHLYFTT